MWKGFWRELKSTYRHKGLKACTYWAFKRGPQLSLVPIAYSGKRILSPFILGKHELKSLASTEGRFFEYGQEETLDIPEPDFPVNVDCSVREKSGQYTISEPFCAVLDDVSIYGKFPFMTRSRKIISEVSVSPQLALTNLYRSLGRGSSRKSNQKHEFELATVLGTAWNSGYFHWTVETLTRLEGVEVFERETGLRPTLILSGELKKFQEESLHLLGYEDQDWIAWEGRTGRIDKAVIPSVRREFNRGTLSPAALQWLREKLLAAVHNGNTPKKKRRIYISRDDAFARQVENEDEVMELLSDYGFTKYVLSDLSVEQQVKIFSEAELIVGPHGANLTNIAYSSEAGVIELFRETPRTLVYYMLSKQVGNWYGYLVCPSVHWNLRVDVEKLSSAVETAIFELGG